MIIFYMVLIVAGLILGFRKDIKLARVGKSIECFAFLLLNFELFYTDAYERMNYWGNTTIVWKWIPFVISIGILAICLLIIWKPFDDKELWVSVLCLSGAMVVLIVVTAFVGTYNKSFFEDLLSFVLWPIHLALAIFAFIVYLCFRKNKIAARIGISIIFACISFFAAVIVSINLIPPQRAWIYFDDVGGWLTVAIFLALFGICIFYIWDLFSVKVRKIIAFCLVTPLVIAFISVVGYNSYEKSILEIQGTSEEINLYLYEPFRKNTLAKNLDEPSALKLQGNLPRLDGATALYPLYAAFARATYAEAEYNAYLERKEHLVLCSRTAQAFDNLIENNSDLIFLMGVSEEQHEQARELGLELKLTPIGKEAFIFFVNRRNPAFDLSVDSIKDIYSGQATNWRQVGRGNREIIVYQRPNTSGSQVMLKEIMGDIPIINPPEEFIYDEMKGMYNAVAYKNYRNSLGYSFLYYIRDMIAEDKVKFLSINGIEPTSENIANDTYPFANDFYAITIVRETETEEDAERMMNTEKLIDWILSPQGQSLVEKTGYVPLLEHP
ncbi:MAG: substrate-binding domain-containing protein [Oscillospiraceae bacterium]|nr:substrate-binding domain-containing protein [Oscillospiraceae bacterium]